MTKPTAPRKTPSARPRARSSAPDTIVNRRREWRLTLPLAVLVQGRHPRQGPFEEKTTLENISSTGAYFRLSTDIPVGARLKLLIELPERLTDGRKTKLSLTGSAVRLEKPEPPARKQGVAVRFLRSYRFLEAERA